MINNPQGIEYDKIVDLALNVLIDYNIYDFPLNIEIITEKLNIKLNPYSKLSSNEYEEFYKVAPLGFTSINQYNDKHCDYTIFYNDINYNNENNRFTIAHEIGHVVSGDIGSTITEKEEKLYDYFAKCLLAPQCLIISNKEFDINTVVTKYKISKQVADNWLHAIISRKSSYGENCLTNIEKQYIEEMKKYHNHPPASNRL